MKNEWNDTDVILESVEIDNCTKTEEILSPVFRKILLPNEKMLIIVMIVNDECIRNVVASYDNVGLKKSISQMLFVFPCYDTMIEYQEVLVKQYITFTYMPINSYMRQYKQKIDSDSTNQIRINDVVYSSSLAMNLISHGIKLYRDNNGDMTDIDYKLFRYLLYKSSFVNYGLTVQLDTSNEVKYDYYFGVINQHLTVSKLDTYSTVFRSSNKELPYFGPPTVEYKVSNAITIILYVFIISNVVVNVCFAVFIIWKRKSKIIRRAFASFCIMVLIGSIALSLSALLIVSFPSTPLSCSAQISLLLLSVCYVLSTLFIKIWKVHKVLNNTGIKRVTVSPFDLIYNVIVITVVYTVYLTIWTFSFPPKIIISIDESQTDIMKNVIIKDCSYNIPCVVIATLFLVIFYCLLLYTSFRLRNADYEFNESMTITFSSILIYIFFIIIIFGVLVISPTLIYLDDYSMKVIILGMGISLISTLISIVIIGQKLYLYFLNAQDAKNSRSGESDEYSVCKSPISVTNEKVIKGANNFKIPTTSLPDKVENTTVKVSIKSTLLKPSIQGYSQAEQPYDNNHLRSDKSNYSACMMPSENNRSSIKPSLHTALQNATPPRHSVVSTTSLVSSKYMIKGEKFDMARSNLSKSNGSKSKGFEGKEEENLKMSKYAKNSQYLYASPSDSTTLPPIKGLLFTPASLDYKSDSSNKSNKSESKRSSLSGGTLKVGNSNTTIVHEKTLIVGKSNEVV